MNLRRHKHFIQGKVWANVCITLENAFWQGVIDRALALTPEEQAASDARQAAQFDALWTDMMSRQAVRQLVEADDVEAAKVEYVVAKVSTGEVVGTFDYKEDALALIDKHVRQKKAKLALV